MLHRRRHKTPGPPSLEAGTAWGGRWAAHDSSLPIPPPPTHTQRTHLNKVPGALAFAPASLARAAVESGQPTPRWSGGGVG